MTTTTVITTAVTVNVAVDATTLSDDQVENRRVEAPASTITRADMAIEVQVAHNIMTDTPEKEV